MRVGDEIRNFVDYPLVLGHVVKLIGHELWSCVVQSLGTESKVNSRKVQHGRFSMYFQLSVNLEHHLPLDYFLALSVTLDLTNQRWVPYNASHVQKGHSVCLMDLLQ